MKQIPRSRRWCSRCGRQHRRAGVLCRGAHLIGKQDAYKLRKKNREAR